MSRVNASRLLILFWMAGCASGERVGPDLADLSVRNVGECAPEEDPAELPGADRLVDTAGLNESLRQMLASADTVSGEVVLTMEYQEDGLNVRRDILHHDVSPTVADSVQSHVFAHRRSAPEAERAWGARLRIALGEEISYAVSRREYCPPRPRNPEMETAMRGFISTGPRYRGGVRERTVIVRVLVHPAGYVAGASVLRGASPGSTLERNLATHLRQFSFEPATIDGRPVYGHIDVPVQIRG